jgi:hypothetical protein
MLIYDRMELLFIVLFRYMRKVREEQLQKAANIAAAKFGQALPIVTR